MTIARQPPARPEGRIRAVEGRTKRPHQSNGAAAVALLAAGIGSAVFGINVILSELWEPFERAFNICDPVGPLSGQSTFAVVVWLARPTLLPPDCRQPCSSSLADQDGANESKSNAD